MAITTVFINNRSQAVRLPAEVRLPDNVRRVEVRAVGNQRIITPLEQSWDSFFAAANAAPDDFLPQRAGQAQAEREPL